MGINMNNARNIKLKRKKCYEENDHLYLELVYEYENESGVYELIVPKIDLDIWTKRLPVFNSSFGLLNEYYTVNLGNHEYDLKSADVMAYSYTEEKRVLVHTSNCVISTIEEKKHEMTLEEIEKKLGYKVKIVSEKEK